MDETGAYYTEWSKPERKTPIQYTNTYICQQNFSKQNSATHKKVHTPWSSWVYSSDAKILQYMQINQGDTPY